MAGQVAAQTITNPNSDGWEDSAPQTITDPNAGGWEDAPASGASSSKSGWRERLDQALTISPAHMATLHKLDAINRMGTPTTMTTSPNQISNLALAGSGVLRGGARMITHPIDTLSSLAQGLYDIPASSAELLGNAPQIAARKPLVNTPSSDRVQAQIDSVKAAAHDPEKAGELVGQSIVGEGLGRLGGLAVKTVKAIPKAANAAGDAAMRAATDTTKADTAKFGEKMIDKNQAAIDRAAETNANRQATYQDKLKQYNESLGQAQDAESQRQAALSHVDQVEPQLKARIKAAQTKAKSIADSKYQKLNDALDGEQTHPEFAQELLDNATSAMKGSATETPIMKDIEDQFMPIERNQAGKIVRDEDGEPVRTESQPISYRDLQGYRSEINSALESHNLEGDVYQAYKGMRDAIDDQMQKIANRNDLGDAMKDARSTYQKYANTFQERSSPAYKAIYTKFPRNGAAIKVFQNNDAGLGALAEHDPQLAADIDSARQIQANTRKIPTRVPNAPQLPTSVPAKTTIVGPDELQAAKEQAIRSAATKIGSRGKAIAVGGAAWRAGLNLAKFRPLSAMKDLAIGAAGAIASGGLENYMTRPANLAKYSAITADDVAALRATMPPEQLGDFTEALRKGAQAAEAKGISVSPALRSYLGTVGAAQGLALPSSHPLSTQFIPQVATGATK